MIYNIRKRRAIFLLMKGLGVFRKRDQENVNGENFSTGYLPKPETHIPGPTAPLSLCSLATDLCLFLRYGVSRLGALWPNGNRCWSCKGQDAALWSSKNMERMDTHSRSGQFHFDSRFTSSMNMKKNAAPPLNKSRHTPFLNPSKPQTNLRTYVRHASWEGLEGWGRNAFPCREC